MVSLECTAGGRIVGALVDQRLEDVAHATTHELAASGGDVPLVLGHERVIAVALFRLEIDEDALFFVVGDVPAAGQLGWKTAIDLGTNQGVEVQVTAVLALGSGGETEAPGSLSLV